jgi:NifU-like protein involved in Fe-S cluster formation
MKNMDEAIKYIENWLRINEGNQKSVPIMKKLLQVLYWQRETLKSMPLSIKNRMPTGFFSDDFFQLGYNNIKEYIPEAKPVNIYKINDTIFSSTGTSSIIFASSGLISNLEESGQEWAMQTIDSYEQIKDELHIVPELKNKLQNLDPELVNEFDLMEDNFYRATNEIEFRVNTSTAMRNILEHVKGKLLAKARKPYEQKIKWNKMVERLCINSENTFEYQTLIDQESVWKEIHTNLSQYLKNNIHCSIEDIKNLRIALITHLYTILSLTSL